MFPTGWKDIDNEDHGRQQTGKCGRLSFLRPKQKATFGIQFQISHIKNLPLFPSRYLYVSVPEKNAAEDHINKGFIESLASGKTLRGGLWPTSVGASGN